MFSFQAKQILRDTDWSMGSPARENLWRELCRHHSREKDFGDYYYWDTVKQIYGSTGEKLSILKNINWGSLLIIFAVTFLKISMDFLFYEQFILEPLT